MNRLSRFTLNADFTLNMSSQLTVLDVPTDRGMCCHAGGDIDFDAAGNLYLSTGDDTNPFDSSGYTPIDERSNRNPAYDAQRSAANTNDLRGKVLRIKVNANGTYSIPAGNLFPQGTAGTRPEIYAMGLRNPFRFNVDKPTGAIYLGEYGPDAGSASSTRGPGGQVEFNRITSAGNYGWPYCTGSNTTAETYVDYTFPSGPSGARFNCAAPVNDSPRNTGMTEPAGRPPCLDQVRQLFVRRVRLWLRVADERAGVPLRRRQPLHDQVPARAWTLTFSPPSSAGAGSRPSTSMPTARPGRSATSHGAARKSSTARSAQTVHCTFWTTAPDGTAAMPTPRCTASNTTPRATRRRPPERAPTARPALAPLAVNFSSAGSSDPEGSALTYSWNFGDGNTSTAANPSHTYTTNGVRTATLTVTDTGGRTGTASVVITVGNTAPTVSLSTPINGSLFSFGDTVPYTISVSDPEDGTIDCARVKLSYILGHDSHGHVITSRTGCSGTLQIPVDGEHDAAANLFGVFDAEYTDLGANGQPALTTHAQNILQPRHRQAEHRGTQSGTGLFSKTSAEGGQTVGDIHNGDWIAFQPYALAGETRFAARVSSGGSGGTLSVRAGSPTGTVLGTVTVPVTGGWETFTEVSTTLSNVPAGTVTLYLTFHGSGTGNLFDVDAFTFGTSTGSRTGQIRVLQRQVRRRQRRRFHRRGEDPAVDLQQRHQPAVDHRLRRHHPRAGQVHDRQRHRGRRAGPAVDL